MIVGYGINPANGYKMPISSLSWLWCILFGPFFFLYKGVWKHFFISFILSLLTFWIVSLIYAFFAKSIIINNFGERGWKIVAQEPTQSTTIENRAIATASSETEGSGLAQSNTTDTQPSFSSPFAKSAAYRWRLIIILVSLILWIQISQPVLTNIAVDAGLEPVNALVFGSFGWAIIPAFIAVIFDLSGWPLESMGMVVLLISLIKISITGVILFLVVKMSRGE
jgi:hypothetical protein